MAKVKGSKEHKWQVVKYNAYSRIVIGLLVVIVVVVCVQAFYFIKFKNGTKGHESTLTSLEVVEQKLAEVRQEKNKIAQELEYIKVGGKVDQKSLEAVRMEVVELRSTIAALEEGNQFYRNLMAPTGSKKGLSFGTVEIISTERPRTYHYKVVMQQRTTNHQLLRGSLSFNILGRSKDAVKVLSLSEVSSSIDSVKIKLRFKYFQDIEGELILPEGFEPKSIELSARSTGKKATTVEKRFAWLVEER